MKQYGGWQRFFDALAFPGLLKYYAMLHILVFGLRLINPELDALFVFDRDKIFDGEWWRVVSFLFATTALLQVSVWSVLCLFMMVMICIMMSSALEDAWGVTKATWYQYVGILALIGVHFVIPDLMSPTGVFVYSSSFFAFATLFPRVQFMMFYVIPVQIRFLAWLQFLILLLLVCREPKLGVCYLIVYGNYLIWAGFPALKRMVIPLKRQASLNISLASGRRLSFHRCVVCQATELSAPALEFRVGADGQEYCEKHLGDASAKAPLG